jgi:hypothetical protein
MSAGQSGTNRTTQAEISSEFWRSFRVQVKTGKLQLSLVEKPGAGQCLTQVLASLFKAQPGQICLTLTDIVVNTDFDLQHCIVRDTTVNPSVPVPNDTLTAKKWCFTLAANKSYSVQLVCAQNPAIGSRATLAACGKDLMEINDTNQIQNWTVQS